MYRFHIIFEYNRTKVLFFLRDQTIIQLKQPHQLFIKKHENAFAF